MMANTSSRNYDRDWVVGQDALNDEAILSLTYPIQHGIIVDFNAMEKVWRHVFKKLDIQPSKCALLITEPAISDFTQRKAMVEVMFERYKFKSVLVATPPVLTLIGITQDESCTGIAVEIGHGLTQVVPIVDRVHVQHVIKIGNVSGDDITYSLAHLLARKDHQFHQPDFRKIVNMIKEKFCYVAAKPLEEETKEVLYERCNLLVTLRSERWKCMETLFSPNMGIGIVELIKSALREANLQSMKHIGLGGGTSSAKGFGLRMLAEIESCYGIDVEVVER